MSVHIPQTPPFRSVTSIPGLVLALVAVLIPFLSLLAPTFERLALTSLPLALLAALMERATRRPRDR